MTLNIYPISHQSWRKALQENRRHGFKSYFARDCRTLERRSGTYGAYMLARGKPADAVYIRRSIGTVEDGVARTMLLTGRVRRLRVENPYKAGDKVTITRGALADIKAIVLETRGRTCLVAHEMFRKQHTQAISYTQLRPG